MKTLIYSFFLLVTAISLQAQTGTIAGTVNDGQLNDILPFANILVQGTTKGTTSDFDGKYTLDVEPGTYVIEFSFVGYTTQQISEVVVKEGSTTVLDVTLSGASLDEVVITTTARKNTEQSVLNLQRKSVQLLDGLSLESIKKSGASNVASAVRNVPGVSVQGGKYVYVRGLGDRYTKTILNGVDVPGLDPDRNTLQLDIFPSSLLENIIVVKSSTADQPADFTGGVVDIVTKDIPNGKQSSASIGLGYNPDFHFNSNYITNESSGTDFLGFDDGLRSNPFNENQEFNFPTTTPNTAEFLAGRLNPTLAAARENSGADMSLSFTTGNSYDVGDNKLGFLASVSYKNETTYYDDYVDGQRFRKDTDPSIFELNTDRTQQGERGENNVLISALGGLSYKTDRSKYRFNVLHIQNGESGASLLTQTNRIDNSNTIKKDVLIYTERGLTNLFFSGKHTNEDASWTTEWKLSPTFSNVDDKDFRTTPFLINEDTGDFIISPSESGDASRFFRELDEINVASKLDLTRKHQLFEKDAKLKFGGAFTYKQRDFATVRFSTPFRNFDSTILNGDPNAILGQYAYSATDDSGFFVRQDSNENDSYDSNINIAALYASEEFRPSSWFTAIVGLRAEKFDLIYTGQDQNGNIFDEEKILDKFDLFPSANLIFDMNEEGAQKLRASFARTTARPSFKEASLAQIFNPIENELFIGNINLQPTYINNFDLRYEIYGEEEKKFGLGDFLALSGFYKKFKDPIELTFFAEATGQVTPRNLGDAEVYGVELELRKSLDIIGLDNFSLNLNTSIIESNETYNEDELILRQALLKEGEDLGDGRVLQGQSPFLLNAGIAYESTEGGWKSGLFYNVQGKTLEIVAAGEIADVYTLPFNDLKFNLSKSFGEDQNQTITFKAGNLLNDDRESVFQSFGAQDQLYSKWSPGQDFSLSYSFKF
ncbi:TonB-dependent receptor [Dokdonia donghaensis]|uniref:TonB-dependent receptor n=1 Tax=Dokdonia donghaensis DSW-1 TaxID=1300343 RepID=A0A0A2GVJ1_9FLAO|nr:TonB-dependent receptor [Dokdonia donghaensis]ANH59934.1 TonB-dependent Receptor Plug Domain protein [Dokdonia donghaensis DSW-1]KGO07252.1 TonB-dependent receptor [Dokdonia donghaensis DSW-1]